VGAAKLILDANPVRDPMLDILARLPFSLIVNTVPGVSIEDAFDDLKPNRQVGYYDFYNQTTSEVSAGSTTAPFIYHLYGSLESVSSLVLSDSDLLDFLIAVVSGEPELPATLKSALTNKRRTFLFLGFRLHTWQLRILMRVLAKDTNRVTKSFALEHETGPLDVGTRNFYQEGHKIEFFDMDVAKFIATLDSKVDSPDTTQAADAVVDAAAPLVFMCHASEDAKYAKRLADDLREENIQVWIDQDGLLGGDRWDSTIEKAIQKEVDYFLVLQSKALKAKRASKAYVNKEINLALEEQEMLSSTGKFVIPVVIDDDANMLDDLDDYQSVDLTVPEGPARLASVIRRDQERKRRL